MFRNNDIKVHDFAISGRVQPIHLAKFGCI